MNIYTEQKISPSGKLNKEDLKSLSINLVKFAAPGISVFFAQLAMKVDIKAAALVALLVLYGSLSDFFSKLNTGK